MARIVSLVVLIVILLAVGGLFLQVMAGFLLPLFLALLLVVIFGPLARLVPEEVRRARSDRGVADDRLDSAAGADTVVVAWRRGGL